MAHETGNTSTETREAAQIRSEAKRIHSLLYPRESWQGDGQVMTPEDADLAVRIALNPWLCVALENEALIAEAVTKEPTFANGCPVLTEGPQVDDL